MPIEHLSPILPSVSSKKFFFYSSISASFYSLYKNICNHFYRCSTKENLDPVATPLRGPVDERKKLFLTTQRLIDYRNSQVVAGSKRVWKLGQTCQLDKEKLHILARKRRPDSDLEFFLGSNMFVRWVALRPPLERTPQKMMLVNFRFLTSP